MARKNAIEEIDLTLDAPEETPEMPVAPVQGEAALELAPPTLEDAFRILCEAMMPHLEDNVPAYSHCLEIQRWHADGNHAIAFRHAIHLLEGILGVDLTHK